MSLDRKQDVPGSVSASRAGGEQAPVPEYILRCHASQINTVAFSPSRDLLYSGDSDGFVAAWSLDTFRPILFARLHSASVLTVEEWLPNRLISHGRDNKIHVTPIPTDEMTGTSTPSVASPTPATPLSTIEVNALGYCKCAVLRLPGEEALVAVPSTLKDELVDVFHLPSGKRVHRSIGKDTFEEKTGTVMALGLYLESSKTLRVAATYEDGRFALFSLDKGKAGWEEPHLEENAGWQTIFIAREHTQPTMSLAIEGSCKRAWVVAADHLVSRYELSETDQPRSRAFKTAYPGRAGIAVRDDDRILAIAGWDGVIRIHSAKSFKPLAVLEYHRDSVYAVAFASVQSRNSSSEDTDPCADIRRPTRKKRAWLAAAGKDERISLWELYPVH